MASEKESSSLLPQLKFRVVQPVDIPRCHQLESLAYPPETAASTSTLQGTQHRAAPFFCCSLLKKANQGKKENKKIGSGLELNALSMIDDDDDEGRLRRKESNDEACHHVHHSSNSELIGYVYATRCHNVLAAAEEESPKTSEKLRYCPYSTKHEANGRFLTIHSIVVQKEYQRLGVARALLEYYIKSIEIYNSDLGEAGLNRRRNQLKAKKPDTGIERIILMSYSSVANLFLSVGFRWRATVQGGEDPLYELEREVKSSPLQLPVSLPDLQPHPLLEQPCFLVDVFSNPREQGSGNPAAIVVLRDSPTTLIADYSKDIKASHSDRQFMPTRDVATAIALAAKAVQEDDKLANDQAEAWMRAIAREFNQPATAFVWPLDFVKNEPSPEMERMEIIMPCKLGLDLITDEDQELSLSYHEENSKGPDLPSESHHFIQFYTREGIETDMCIHATLAAASVLFTPNAAANVSREKTISFHSRNDQVLQSFLANPTPLDESYHSSSALTRQAQPHRRRPSILTAETTTPYTQFNSTRIAMDCPWTTVEPVPPGSQGQGAVLAMLRRSFFRAWSAVSQDEDNKDHDTDELAFSLSADHVLFVGLTSGGDHLFIELTVEGFDMCGRSSSVDYDALRQGFTGCTKGVIICCEVPETLGADPTSEDVPNGGDWEGGGSNDPELPEEEVSIDFCCRFFEPTCEDPVSGLPHCALGPYFGARRGKHRLVGLQSSDRGGLVECILREEEQKVCIIGAAVTTLVGKTMMGA